MKMKNKIPKASIAIVIAAVLVITAGTVLAATVSPDIISEDYKAEFTLDNIDISLVENGTQAKDIESKELLSELEGNIQPGRAYETKLAAKNMTNVPALIRMVVTVAWKDPEGNKDPSKDPSLIELSFEGDEYNKNAWQINPAETTRERRVFYLSEILPAETTSSPVVNQLRISNDVLKAYEMDKETKGNQTVYTFTYEYDGYQIYVSADCQGLQTHNANEAIKSSWGVTNVKVSGNKVKVG